MSDDLISRKALLDRLTENFQNINYHPDFGDPAVGMEQNLLNEFLYDMIKLAEEQPTAYDVDKVIEQIGKKMFSAELHDNGWDGQTINELLCMGDVYEIVKAGGVDECKRSRFLYSTGTSRNKT